MPSEISQSPEQDAVFPDRRRLTACWPRMLRGVAAPTVRTSPPWPCTRSPEPPLLRGFLGGPLTPKASLLPSYVCLTCSFKLTEFQSRFFRFWRLRRLLLRVPGLTGGRSCGRSEVPRGCGLAAPAPRQGGSWQEVSTLSRGPWPSRGCPWTSVLQVPHPTPVGPQDHLRPHQLEKELQEASVQREPDSVVPRSGPSPGLTATPEQRGHRCTRSHGL